jgi:hypothetical protein
MRQAMDLFAFWFDLLLMICSILSTIENPEDAHEIQWTTNLLFPAVQKEG